jgi:hypothetical protein
MAYRVRYNNKPHRNNPVISKLNVVEIDTSTFDAEFEAFCEEQKKIKAEKEAKKHRHKKKTE